MDSRGNCADIRPHLGVYLTGAIAPGERARVVRHLVTCTPCREELTNLAALPGLLHRSPATAVAEPPVRSPAAPSVPPMPPMPPMPPPAAEGAPLGRVLRRIALRRRRNRWLAAVAAVVLAAGVAAGWVLRTSLPSASGRVTSGTVLEIKKIGGVTVLTDAQGLTLYWYTPDSSTASNCNDGCARRWPPVTGPAIPGHDVRGTLGSITRADGTLQVIYNGHPLYTASADTMPGQTKGNDVRDPGGEWHEVVVSGRPAPAPSWGY